MVLNVHLDSFFSETIVDNNGNNSSDINKGLDLLFDYFNQYSDKFFDEQRYLVSEDEDGYPDLVAYRSKLKSEDYWWWICLLNKIEDPLGEFGANWVYSIVSQDQINNFVSAADENNESGSFEKSIVGTIVSLN